MSEQNFVIAMYSHHSEAEKATKRLQHAGFNMTQLSIVGRNHHSEENVVGYYRRGDRMKFWGGNGAFRGLWEWLFESALFVVPGIGNLIVLGPLVNAMVGALEGAVFIGGLSALGAGLYSLGIPKNSVPQYETAIMTDNFLIIGHGTDEEVDRATDIIQTTNVVEYAVHAG